MMKGKRNKMKEIDIENDQDKNVTKSKNRGTHGVQQVY